MSGPRSNRRDVLKTVGVTGAASLFGGTAVGSAAGSEATRSSSLTANDESLEQQWSVETGGRISSIYGGSEAVYYATSDSLHAVDAGEEDWQTDLDTHFERSTSTYALVHTADTLIVFQDVSRISQRVVAFEAETGQHRWTEEFPSRIRGVRAEEGDVFVFTAEYTYRYDHESGEVHWREPHAAAYRHVSNDVAFIDGMVVFPTNEDDPSVVGLGIDSGELEWEVDVVDQAHIRRGPERVYTLIPSRFTGATDTDTLHAITPTDGTVEWTHEFDAEKDVEVGYGSFRATDGKVILASEVDDDHVEGESAIDTFDGQTGEKIWDESLMGNRPRMTVANGSVIVAVRSVDHEVAAFDIETGDFEWSIEPPGLSGTSGSPPLVEHEGLIYHIRDAAPGDRVWAIDSDSGDLEFDIGIMGSASARILSHLGTRDSAIRFSDDRLLVPTNDGSLRAVRPAGEDAWEIRTGGSVEAVDRTSARTFGLTNSGELVAVDGESGDIDWTAIPEGIGSEWGGASQPVVIDDYVVTVTEVPRESEDLRITAFDRESGDEQWEHSKSGRIAQTELAAGTIHLLFTTGGFSEGYVTAFDPDSGDEPYEIDLSEVIDGTDDINDIYGLAAQNESVYIVFETGDVDVVAAAFAEADGTLQWSEHLGEPHVEAGPPMLGEDVLIPTLLDAEDGAHLVGLSPDDGQQLWSQSGSDVRDPFRQLRGITRGHFVYFDEDTFDEGEEELKIADATTGEVVETVEIDREDEDTPREVVAGVGNVYVYAYPSLEAIDPDGSIADSVSVQAGGMTIDSVSEYVYVIDHSELTSYRDGTAELPEEEADDPTAAFTYTPADPASGTEITFTATDAEVEQYEWDLTGDGDTDATGAEVTSTYDEAGEYEVTLTVTDDDGNTDSASQTIEVAAPDDDNGEASVDDYADADGIVHPPGVLEAIDDWRDDQINTPLVLDVIEAWRSGEPVE